MDHIIKQYLSFDRNGTLRRNANHNLLVLAWGWAMAGSLCGIGAPAVRAEEPETPSISWEETSGPQLVELLGSDEFPLREAAEAEILTRGEEILALVRQAKSSPDPEVQLRAAAIYEQLFDRLRDERFERFVAMEKEVDLPGWKRFEQQHGDNQANRTLYVQMLRDEWDLLVKMESHPHLIDYLFFQRANKLRETFHNPELRAAGGISRGSTATMFHVASQSDVRVTQAAMEQMRFLLANAQISGLLQDADPDNPMLSVFEHWIRANLEMGRLTSEMRFAVLVTCMRDGIKSGTILAKQILKDRGKPVYEDGFSQLNLPIDSDQQVLYAMLAIAKLGSRDDLPAIRKFLDDESVIEIGIAQADTFTTQFRDVALAVEIHLWGKSPKDFGFTRIATDPNYVFNVRSIGFSSKDQRQAAFEKWNKQRDEAPQLEPAKS